MDDYLLKSGELDTPIEVYQYTSTQNNYGEIIKTTTLLKTVWSKIIPKGGNEKVQDDTIVATSKMNFLVRYDDDFNMTSSTISPENKYTIKYENKMWDILSMETLGRGKGILIKCDFKDN